MLLLLLNIAVSFESKFEFYGRKSILSTIQPPSRKKKKTEPPDPAQFLGWQKVGVQGSSTGFLNYNLKYSGSLRAVVLGTLEVFR